MQNFGKIKNAFYNILIESIVNKDENKKAIFSSYLKALQENKILKTECFVYSNLEDKSEINEAKSYEFIRTNLEFLKAFKKTDIEAANDLLVEKLGKFKKRIEKPYDTKKSKLHEEISKIIFTSKNPKNIDIIDESIGNIVSYIKENEPKTVLKENLVPTNALATIAINKFNSKYSELNEDERKLVKAMSSTDDKAKEDIQKEIVTECVDLIDVKLTEEIDIETKEKLLNAKDKLLRVKYNSNNYFEDVNKLISLKNGLIGD